MALWWQDRSGETSPVRTMALVLAAGPAAWLACLALSGGLGPRPITAAIHFSGDWAVRILLLSLAISPVRRLMNLPRLFPARQILGLASFAYAALHIALYVVDQKFVLSRVLNEVIQRFYLGIGSMAFIGLLILTVTSGEKAIKRIGGGEWNRLHAGVFIILPLTLLHFFIQSKLNVTEPVIMTGFALWLIGYRWLEGSARTSPVALAGLAVAAAIGTQLIELAWYGLATRVPASSIAEGIFDFEFEIRPMWTVLTAGLAVALTPILAGTWTRQPARQIQSPGVQGR